MLRVSAAAAQVPTILPPKIKDNKGSSASFRRCSIKILIVVL
jgi:hypothetical protein